MPKALLILTTGGTFDKRYPEGQWVQEFAFPPSHESAVSDILRRARMSPRPRVSPDVVVNGLPHDRMRELECLSLLENGKRHQQIRRARRVFRRQLRESSRLRNARPVSENRNRAHERSRRRRCG